MSDTPPPGEITLEEVQEIVAFLLERGGYDGIFLAEKLNSKHGASARRRHARAAAAE